MPSRARKPFPPLPALARPVREGARAGAAAILAPAATCPATPRAPRSPAPAGPTGPAADETDGNKLMAKVMHAQPPRPGHLTRAIPRDLETVVLKATAREPAQRYQTPAELAEDLQRFLDDRPIKARRLGVVQRGWRWCRRNPARATLVAVLVVGFAAVAWLWWRAEDRRAEAQRERLAADRQRTRAQK